MHGGGYSDLVSLTLVLLVGAASLASFLVFVLLSGRHSIHGVRGAALFLLAAVLLLSLAAAIDNALWDLLKIRDAYVSAAICFFVAYLPPLVLLGRLYRKGSGAGIPRAIAACGALLGVLAVAWYIAERVL